MTKLQQYQILSFTSGGYTRCELRVLIYFWVLIISESVSNIPICLSMASEQIEADELRS
jgi:hypothetical protein